MTSAQMWFLLAIFGALVLLLPILMFVASRHEPHPQSLRSVRKAVRRLNDVEQWVTGEMQRVIDDAQNP